MLGAMIGDVVGSRFEWHNVKSKKFEFLSTFDSRATDDSIMTAAIAKAVMDAEDGKGELSELATRYMQDFGRRYPGRGYGGNFGRWIHSSDPKPYYSYGNGSAMRVSAVGFAAKDIEDAKKMSYAVTAVTHDHPEGIKGAEAVAVAIVLARQGKSMDEIRAYIEEHYYKLYESVDDLRSYYDFDVSCQGTMPEAFQCFYESTSFEDAIRTGISIGGDSDTIGAIIGGIAEAYYGIPSSLKQEIKRYLPDEIADIAEKFEARHNKK